MKRKRLFGLLLSLALIFSLCACNQEPTPDATEPPTEDPALALYAQAADAVEALTDLKLELTTHKKTTLGIDHYDYESTQTLNLAGIGSDAFTASLTEDVEVDTYDDHLEEYYADGVLHVTVDGENFKGNMDAQKYLQQFAPAVLIDESLYSSVSSDPEGDGQRITFAEPTAPEGWAMPVGAQFVEAEGSALLNAEGALVETTYAVTYRQAGAEVDLEVTSVPTTPKEAPKAPKEEETFTELEYIEAIRLYDTAVMYLCSTASATSAVNETIVSQAAAYTWAQQTKMDFYGTGAAHMAKIDTAMTAAQDGGGTTASTQTELYQDGVYTVSVDGGESQSDKGISNSDMLYYVQGMLLDNILALDYIDSVKSSDVGGLIYLEFGLNDEYGDLINEWINEFLFEDGQFLNDLASSYATLGTAAYMVVDPVTGFPVALGQEYSGTHTIDGVDYNQAFAVSQTFQVSSTTSYKTISGEMKEEKAPETTATPLLYHVTGENGQEMYLMGTIHVGDERTGFLPEAVYAALDGSDALAVELDTAAFEEAMTTDAALAAQISALYLNADGSATSAMLDEDDRIEAVRLLTFSGNYNAMVELMKPAIWNQSIDNYYLTFDRGITADKGLDARLVKRAKESGKEIREIESGLQQMEMLTGFSTDLQLLLLDQSLEMTAAEYCTEARDLYEAWCRGDEAELRGLLVEDLSDMTEEELALYQEYIDAMIIDRNETMLEVAKEYLESGETVFYAVGLAHLLQENGLVDALAEAGYTVEAVSYAE